MARKIKQFKYYPRGTGQTTVIGSNGEKLNSSYLHSGFAFSGYLPIIQLGIQTMPGVIFRLNGANNPITVGSTGIYELDVSDGAAITALQFDLHSLKMIDESNTGYLIIDILYEN